MYSVFAYIHHKNQLNVAKYTIHGWYGWGKKKPFRNPFRNRGDASHLRVWRGKKCRKGWFWGFRWVVCPPFAVLCLLSIFVPCLCRILLGCFWGFSLPKFSSYPVLFFFLSCFFLFYSPSFFHIFPIFCFLFFVLFCLPLLFHFYVVIL